MGMKRIRHIVVLLLLSTILISFSQSFSQLPVCTNLGGLLYLHHHNGTISNYDPSQPNSPTNPIMNTITTMGGEGLAVSNNLNAAIPAITFYNAKKYMVNNQIEFYFRYYDGSKWVFTGHKSFSLNLGAGGGYIYGFAVEDNKVYRYDGTSDAVLVLDDSNLGIAIADIIADCDGNFYLMNTDSRWMRKYSPTGILLKQWFLIGGGLFPYGGFGIIDNTVYYDALDSPNARDIVIYKGTVNGDTIYFNAVSRQMRAEDMANCPKPLYSISKDTLFYCSGTPTFSIKANGNPPYTHRIVSGNATVTGTGPNFTVTGGTDISMIVLESSNPATCGATVIVSDTFIIVPQPVVDAGRDKTITGCGQYRDTLQASLTNAAPWIDYNIAWSPSVSAGETPLTPIVEPTENATYTLTVTMPANQGGCIVKDTVKVTVADKAVTAEFYPLLNYGCEGDTVRFVNTSLQSTKHIWFFGDGATDTSRNTFHIYPGQNNYDITLIAANDWCMDSITKFMDTRHPLIASFAVDDDTICQGEDISILNASVSTLPPVTYYWDFADGTTVKDTTKSHRYTQPGVYSVMMIASDAIQCSDTAYKIITVDSLPSLYLTISSKNICNGQSVTLAAHATQSGQKALNWEFANNMIISQTPSLTRSFDEDGSNYIKLTAIYRACADVVIYDTLIVHALPQIWLAADTSLCLEGAPVVLTNHSTNNNRNYHYLWSTGDTTRNISIKHYGTYSLSLTDDHTCTAADTITINKSCYLDIPNAFTPDGDGYNDYFIPRQQLSRQLTNFHMDIFNRWGQLIFSTANIDGRGWDGKLDGIDQSEGVYIYQITVKINDYNIEKYNGNLTLFR